MNTSQLPAAAAGTFNLGGLTLNRMGFGAMQLPGPGVWGEPKNPAEAKAVLQRAVQLGVNLLDTAGYYGPYVSDRLIVEALYPYPAGLVICTKVGARRGPNKSWLPFTRPEHLREDVEDNLQRLKLEQLQLVHFRLQSGEYEEGSFMESIGEMARLQQEGKIQHVGLSNVGVDHILKAQSVLRVASIENMYSFTHTAGWNSPVGKLYGGEGVLEVCEREGIAFFPFFSIMSLTPAEEATLAQVAQRHNATPKQVALAWMLHRSPNIVAIPGTSKVAHLEENVAAAALKLTTEDMAALGK